MGALERNDADKSAGIGLLACGITPPAILSRTTNPALIGTPAGSWFGGGSGCLRPQQRSSMTLRRLSSIGNGLCQQVALIGTVAREEVQQRGLGVATPIVDGLLIITDRKLGPAVKEDRNAASEPLSQFAWNC